MLKLVLSILLTFSFNIQAATSINVLTLNTWMIPTQGKIPKERAKLIGKNVEIFDLVFMQEAFTKKVRKIIKANADSKFNDLYKKSPGSILGSGLYNLSGLKINNADFMPFKSCGSIQCGAKKGALYMQVQTPDGTLIDTFNTHLQAYYKDAAIREKQLKETIKFIKQKVSAERPAIFAGDFNIIASTSEYSVLENYLIGFKDVWLDFRASDAGFTWNPDLNRWASYDDGEPIQLQRIDYIFVKDGTNKKWNILETNIEFNKTISSQSGPIFLSDHFGVSAALELN